MTVDLTSLNDNQRKAVLWSEGPLLILAGPGSGKTRVLTFRIAHLIQQTPHKYFRILGLTFTNKAAAEMRKRIESLVANAGERTLLTTFHSFAADLLRQHGHHIGLKPDFTILVQEEERQSILDEAIDHIKAGERFSSEALLPLMTRLIDRNVDPQSALQYLQKTYHRKMPPSESEELEDIASIYESYRQLMIQHNALDFSGLVAEALGLLKTHSGIRRLVQRVYPYVCVDEYQDTNFIQDQILRHIVNTDKNNLFVVADDDQIIYQWNGASPKRLWTLRQDFNMSLIQLPQNYRCPPDVVNLANHLIEHNFGRPAEKHALTSHKPAVDVPSVRLEHFSAFDKEADWVAADLAARDREARGHSVVLARTKRLLATVIEALDAKGVPGYLAVRKNEFESASLQWLHAVLRLANERNSREHLRRVCKAFFALEGISLNVKDIVARSSAERADYLRTWIVTTLKRNELSEATRRFLQQSAKKLSDRLDVRGFEKDAFGWLDQLPNSTPDEQGIFDEYEDEKQTWHGLVTDISSQYEGKEVTLHLLLQELDLRSKSPAPPKDAIPCFTIHAAKGMEFDHVYLVGLVEDQLPSWTARRKGETSKEMQEERRNCFVAITRAQKSLTLTYSQSAFGWPKTPSRFLYEMGLLNGDSIDRNPS